MMQSIRYRDVHFRAIAPSRARGLGAARTRLSLLARSSSRLPLLVPSPSRPLLQRASATSMEDGATSTVPAESITEADVVIVGSGIGGLCAGAILGRYGYNVCIVESHYLPGGAAHSFKHKDAQGREWEFEAGPSFHAGLSMEKGKSNSPLKMVLDAIGEPLPCVQYNNWRLYLPEGPMNCVADAEAYAAEIRRVGGEASYQAWKRIEKEIAPLGEAAALLPATALRFDALLPLTAAKVGGPGLLKTAFAAGTITGPFSKVVERHAPTPFLRNLMDLECFVLSGVPARHTICAEMAFMLNERGGSSTIDYPVGGTYAVVQALIRGVEKFGGRILLRSHVEEILTEGGQAVGVRLRGSRGRVIRARKAVISNASVWDTQKILSKEVRESPNAAVQQWMRRSQETRPCDSFLHLHLGIDARGLEGIDCHHVVVRDWPVEKERNVILTSIPSVFDPSMAPQGKHVVHCYSAGNEPYSVWEKVKYGSPEYEALKRERVEPLYAALEKFIPDIRKRVEVELIGTPLTHERFLRRHRGSYGPALHTDEGEAFPGPATPVKNLFCVGDSCQPGIGVPAAAASGLICANSLALGTLPKQLELIEELAAAAGRA